MSKKTTVKYASLVAVGLLALLLATTAMAGKVRKTNVYFGDTHLHTSYSPDAYLMGNRTADPDTAYRYAKGLPVIHPFHRARIQIKTPLDFLVVADHGEFMGVIPRVFAGDPMVANTPTGKRWYKWAQEGKPEKAFVEAIAAVNAGKAIPDLDSPEVKRTMWGQIMDAAERHNQPGKFTTFLGWEWSSTPDGANLHRIIFLREGKKIGSQFLPYTAFDSAKPEELWKWLDATAARTKGNFIAIPHNSNISKGLMFPVADSYGKPITAAYAQARMRWEPVVEATQIKGDSETHSALSPNDEFADFETYDHVIEVGERKEVSLFGHAMLQQLSKADREYLLKHEKRVHKVGDYVRSGLMRGLAIKVRIGANPYKFGMVGSTDSHTGMSSSEEDNFHGKMAIDSTPESKMKLIIPPDVRGFDMSASGLAAVWAEENTRASIFDAFRRKETYATTGTRLRVRFFGGWSFAPGDAKAADLAAVGYTKGVPMGGDLTKAPKSKAPSFLIHAVKDPNHANLDRIQVVKGWVDAAGKPHEKIFDVALSDGRKKGKDGKVPLVGNTVNLKTAAWTNSIGDPELKAVWSDPEFDAKRPAFYYVRVLQIPTPRNSLYDAVALQKPHSKERPSTIQERAYTSPIWYTP